MQFRGMTLIDVVVGTALVLIIFLGLLGTLRVSVMLSSLVKSQTAATAIANNQMEYIRSLPYDSVGTVGGIPSGSIPQNSTVVQDSVSYTVRTFISYYDDPADGTDVTDSNGITTDYKRIKVSVSYSASGGTPRQVTLVSNYAPPSLEDDDRRRNASDYRGECCRDSNFRSVGADHQCFSGRKSYDPL